MPSNRDDRALRRVLAAQGIYYAATGGWALLHRRSFQRLVGSRPQQFQLDATATLFTVVGSALVLAALRGADPVELRGLAAGVPLGTVLVELRYARRVRPVFLLDAAVELLLAAAVLWAGRRSTAQA